MKPRLWIVLFAALALAVAGCAEKKGDTGPAGTSRGTVSGTVTNGSYADAAISGATVATDPSVSSTDITTDASGNYSVTLPVGSYTFTFSATNFGDETETVSVAAGQTTTVDVAMTPTASVGVSAGSDQTAAAGAAVTLTGTVTSLDGTDITGATYAWTQVSGPTATLSATDTASITATLADLATMKANAFAPPVDADGDLHGPTDRLMVQGFSITGLEQAAVAEFKLTVTVGSKTYTSTVDVDASDSLPYVDNPGLQDVPIGVPVAIRGKSTGTGWSISSAPSGSTAALNDTSTTNIYFTPDVAGTYTISQTGVGTIDVVASNWSEGAIGGIGADGNPTIVGSACAACHKDTATGDALTVYDKYQNWKKTGHAGIFTQNLNAGGHYSPSCFECHTVGYNTSVSNNGMDDTATYSDFLADTSIWAHDSSGNVTHAIANASNWANTVANYPAVAAKANIQCENCHGPGGTSTAMNPLHNNGTLGDAERVSMSSDVCAACHGEETRHARFQQWQMAGHSNFTLAEERAAVDYNDPSRGLVNDPATQSSYGAGDCARCHSGQGFVAWIEDAANNNDVLGDYVPTTTYNPNGSAPSSSYAGYGTELSAMGLNISEVQPQTCAMCHDPHEQGTTAYIPNTATVRVEDNTPVTPAGYAAYGVGRGAVCITCHNTRNGLHNNQSGNSPNDHSGDEYGGPHHGAQGDVLMGQNAYFVTTGVRSPHSYIPDTCTNCHMELSKAPTGTYNPSEPGTNHTFNADPKICSDCHGSVFTADGVQGATEQLMTTLGQKIVAQELADIQAVTGTTLYVAAGAGVSTAPADQTAGTAVSTLVASGTSRNLWVGTYHGEPGLCISALKADCSSSNTIETGAIYVWDDTTANGVYDSATESGSLTQLYPTPLSGTGLTVVEALWNYELINNDASGGVHNPGFVSDLLQTSIGKF